MKIRSPVSLIGTYSVGQKVSQVQLRKKKPPMLHFFEIFIDLSVSLATVIAFDRGS